jgi:hypothetical protein
MLSRQLRVVDQEEESVFSERPTGAQSICLITADPDAVYERCRAAVPT